MNAEVEIQVRAEKVLADLGYFPEANIHLNWLDARNAIAAALAAISAPDVAGLRVALEKWKCPSCDGTGKYACMVNDRAMRLPCNSCDRTGIHPIARAALNKDTADG